MAVAAFMHFLHGSMTHLPSHNYRVVAFEFHTNIIWSAKLINQWLLKCYIYKNELLTTGHCAFFPPIRMKG